MRLEKNYFFFLYQEKIKSVELWVHFGMSHTPIFYLLDYASYLMKVDPKKPIVCFPTAIFWAEKVLNQHCMFPSVLSFRFFLNLFFFLVVDSCAEWGLI